MFLDFTVFAAIVTSAHKTSIVKEKLNHDYRLLKLAKVGKLYMAETTLVFDHNFIMENLTLPSFSKVFDDSEASFKNSHRKGSFN